MNDAAAEQLSEEQVRILGERHVAIVSTGTGSGGTWCREDGWRWPCLPARLLASLEAAQMKAEQWRASLEAGREIMALLVADHDAAVRERDALRTRLRRYFVHAYAGRVWCAACANSWLPDEAEVHAPDCDMIEPASQEPGA